MAQHDTDNDIATIEKITLKTPSSWKVVLLNDDHTPMDFVIEILMSIFAKPFEEAITLMFHVHENGKATAGLYTKEIALTKAKTVIREASSHGFPLQAVAEEA